MSIRFFCLFAFVCVSFGLPNLARADIVYTVRAGHDGGVYEENNSGPAPLELEFLLSNDATQWREVFVRSDPGQLTADAISINFSSNPPINWSSNGRSIFETDDLIFSSPNNDAITTSLNIDLAGVFSRANCCASDGSATNLLVSATIAGNTFFGIYKRRSDENDSDFTDEATGLLSGLTGDTFDLVLTTPNFTVQPNTPLSLKLELGADSGSDDRGTSQAVIRSSLSLAEGGSVFNGLLPGVTVNSNEARINDNVFSAVPEPNSAGEAAVILCLGLLLRRRRKIS